MKGGLTRTEALMMSPKDRSEHIEYITKAYEKKAEALSGQEFM